MVMVGSSGIVIRTVGDDDTAIALGSGDLAVLATPILIALMEEAACQALDGHLPPGHTSVGSRIDVRHLAPTPVGARTTARATVIDVSGSRITFDVAAEHELRGEVVDIGVGTHVRVVVDRSSFVPSR